jgi:TRAP-type C4-dicarboxylate transport system permease small subunit
MLQRFEEWFIIASFCIMSIFAFYQVVTRYVFTSMSFTWTEEVLRHFLVAVTFIGSALVTRKKGHFGVEVLSNLIPSRIKPYHQLYAGVCSLIFSVAVSYVSLQLILKQRILGILTAATRVPIYVITIPIAIGFILSAYYLTRELITVFCDLIRRK